MVDNATAGVIVTSADDLPPLNNQVLGNQFRGNALDIAYTATAAAPGIGNCFADNIVTGPTLPADLSTSMPCPSGTAATAGSALPSGDAPPGIAFTEVTAPPVQPNLAAPAFSRSASGRRAGG